MKPQFVDIIVAIADCGSIGAAAKQLGKSQPAVTGALRNAEQELGDRVFHRVPHGVIPTELGQVVIDRCRRISREIIRLDEELAQQKGDFVGTINVVAATTVASVRILPRALKQYRRNYPNIKVNIVAGRQSQGFQNLLSGEVDFVVGPMPEPHQAGGLKSVPLLETRIEVITGENSRFANMTDPAVLKNANWLVNGPAENRPRYFGFFEDQGIEPPEPVISAESIVCILSMIEGSDDLCCVAREVLDHLQPLGKYVILPLEDQIGTATVGLTFAQDQPHNKAALLFADLIAQNAASGF